MPTGFISFKNILQTQSSEDSLLNIKEGYRQDVIFIRVVLGLFRFLRKVSGVLEHKRPMLLL